MGRLDREAVEEALQLHDLPGNVLRDGEADDLGRGLNVGHDPARLRDREAAEVLTQTEAGLCGVG